MLLQAYQSVLCVPLLRNCYPNETVWCAQLRAGDAWVHWARVWLNCSCAWHCAPWWGQSSFHVPSCFNHLQSSYYVPGAEWGVNGDAGPALEELVDSWGKDMKGHMIMQENTTCSAIRKLNSGSRWMGGFLEEASLCKKNFCPSELLFSSKIRWGWLQKLVIWDLLYNMHP